MAFILRENIDRICRFKNRKDMPMDKATLRWLKDVLVSCTVVKKKKKTKEVVLARNRIVSN